MPVLPSSATLLAQARDEAKAGQWAVALEKAEIAVQRGGGVDAMAFAALCACNVKDLARARSYLSKLPSPEQTVPLQTCLRNGIDPR